MEWSWPIIWVVLAVVLAIIEAITVGLATIWFAIGAIFALAASWLGLNATAQIIIFVFSSLILLILTRPIVAKYLKVGSEKTNVDSLIGKSGIVVSDIREFSYGQVKVGGQVWTAKSVERQTILTGSEVFIVAVEGVKLIVKEQ